MVEIGGICCYDYTMINRPNIPESIKRAVRQKCCFGCVICGAPVYQYDHIEEYSEVQKHEENNITLLCPNHHQDKTAGRITKEFIIQKTGSPFNNNQSFSTPYRLFMSGNSVNLRVGGNQYIFNFSSGRNRFDAVRVNGKSIVGLTNENGNLLLDICMTDRGGNEILKVKESELEISIGIWDFEYVGNNMKIRSQSRNIEFDMCLLNDGVQINRGYYSQPPLALEILPNEHIVWPNNNRMIGCVIEGCRVGLDINSGNMAIGVA